MTPTLLDGTNTAEELNIELERTQLLAAGLYGEPELFESSLTLDLKLQLTRATMSHEYARLEYEKSVCVLRRGELLDEMDRYQQEYQVARSQFEGLDASLLVQVEQDLYFQKQLIFSEFAC